MKLPRSFGSMQSDATTRSYLELLSRALDAYVITFGDSTSNTEHLDIDCWKGSGTSPVGANTEFAVAHQLQRVPWGFWIVQKNVAGDFYGTPTLGTAWTAATATTAGSIFLNCSASSVTFVCVII
jgi:hypothetical protein